MQNKFSPLLPHEDKYILSSHLWDILSLSLIWNKFTCSIPEAKVNGAAIHHHICTEIVKHRWNIILSNNINFMKLTTCIHEMKRILMKGTNIITVGKVLLVYEISIQVFPTAPSPTVTHLMNLAVVIFS